MNNKQLYKISKYTYHEVFLESQLSMAGVNQAKIMEKLEKDSGYVRTIAALMKIMMMIYLGLMVTFPITTYNNINSAIQAGADPLWAGLIGVFTFSVFFFIQALMIVAFQIFFASGILNGECFQWLRTLPVSQKEIKTIVFFTYFRGMDYPLIVMVFVLPIGIGIATQSMILVLLALLFTLENIILTLSLLTRVGNKISKIFQELDSTRGSNGKRVVIVILYFLSLIFSLIAIQLTPLFLPELFQKAPWENYEMIYQILAFIPYPFNPAVILIHLQIQPDITGMTMPLILGAVLLPSLLYRFFKGSTKLFGELENKSNETASQSTLTRADIVIERKSSIEAFFEKDKKKIARDMQILTWFAIPPIYAILAALISAEEMGISFMSLIYMTLSAVFVTVAVLKSDADGSGILSVTPYAIRDQAKAKLRWYALLIIAPYVLAPFIRFHSWNYYLLNILLVPWGVILGVLFFEIKVAAFGKFHRKYVLDEISNKNKILKWTGMVVLFIAILIALIAYAIFMINQSTFVYVIGEIGAEAAVLALVWWLFNKMFPKLNLNYEI